MRALGIYRQRTLRTLSVLVLSLSLGASAGCVRRLQLSPGEFERIDKQEQAVDDLRVYVSKKLVVVYEADDDNADYAVDKRINVSSDQRLLRVIISKGTRGVIMDSDQKNGAPLLWVRFSSRCKDKDCAYGFVQTEDGVFRLAIVPDRDGYKQAKPHYTADKKPLTLNKLKSLAEKNDVYLWKNKRDKVFTIDLIVKKKTDKSRQVNTIRDGGVQ